MDVEREAPKEVLDQMANLPPVVDGRRRWTSWYILTPETKLRMHKVLWNRKAEKIRRWAKRHRQRHRDRLNAAVRERHTKKLIEAANGRSKPSVCDVCGRGGRICFDHCHNSNIFRGWLCSSCNTVLGLMMDNPTLLRELAGYLERFEETLNAVSKVR